MKWIKFANVKLLKVCCARANTVGTDVITTSWFINQYRMHFYVQISRIISTKASEQTPEKHITSIRILKNEDTEFVDVKRRTRCHGNQSLSSPSSIFPRFSLFLRLSSSSPNVLRTGCIPPLPRDSTLLLLLCLFPKRPMGLTPRPTYQKGSISGPGHYSSGRRKIWWVQY